MKSVEQLKKDLDFIQTSKGFVNADLSDAKDDLKRWQETVCAMTLHLSQLDKDEAELLDLIKQATTKKYYIGWSYTTRFDTTWWLVPHVSYKYVMDGVALVRQKNVTESKDGFYKTEIKEDDTGLYVTGLPTQFPKDFGKDDVALPKILVPGTY